MRGNEQGERLSNRNKEEGGGGGGLVSQIFARVDTLSQGVYLCFFICKKEKYVQDYKVMVINGHDFSLLSVRPFIQVSQLHTCASSIRQCYAENNTQSDPTEKQTTYQHSNNKQK